MTTNYLNLTKKQLSKQSFKLLLNILNSNDENCVEKSTTEFSYMGTDNMSLEQLQIHYKTLLDNWNSIK